jgi:hypothetical protein
MVMPAAAPFYSAAAGMDGRSDSDPHPITRSGDARRARSQQSELGCAQSAAPHMRLAEALERRVRFGLKWAQELPRFGDCLKNIWERAQNMGASSLNHRTQTRGDIR